MVSRHVHARPLSSASLNRSRADTEHAAPASTKSRCTHGELVPSWNAPGTHNLRWSRQWRDRMGTRIPGVRSQSQGAQLSRRQQELLPVPGRSAADSLEAASHSTAVVVADSTAAVAAPAVRIAAPAAHTAAHTAALPVAEQTGNMAAAAGTGKAADVKVIVACGTLISHHSPTRT